MTISSSTRKAGPFDGNDSTTAFPFTFKVFAKTDITVTLTSSAGVESTLVLDSDYSVALNADQDVSPGGTVTYPISGDELATGEKLTLSGDLAELQPTALTNGGGFFPRVIEYALDRLVIFAQQLREEADRSIKFPVSDGSLTVELPTATVRASTLLGFDADGNVTAVVPASQSAADLALDLASSTGAGQVGFDYAPLPAAVDKVDWGIRTAAVDVNVLRYIDPSKWTAIAAGTSTVDVTTEVQAAITACLASGETLYFPPGQYYFDGAEFVLSSSITIAGAGRENTRLLFTGTPTKTVRTYATWRVEYDSADYSTSSDDAIACAFVVTSDQVFIRDMNIRAYWDATTDHPLPFDSATDYPTSGYDVGILIQRSDCSLERLLINGPWGSTTTTNTGAIKLDVTQPPGAVEHVKIIDTEAYGRWGLVIEGPHGSGSAPNYAALNANDVRGSGGVSDLLCIGSQFYDTSGNNGVRITIDGTSGKRVRRFTANSGGLFIDGQATNSAARQQQMTFVRCRFAAVDPYAYYINFANRVEFIGCHSEYRAGFLLDDGATTVSGSDVSITTTTNARMISYIGGEKSGETDSRTFKDTTNNLNIVSEIGFDDPDPDGSVPPARMLAGLEIRDRTTFTPTVVGSTSGSAVGTFSGYYSRVGNQVRGQVRLTLSSKNGISGNISIGNLPFTSTNTYGTGVDWPCVVLSSLVATGDAGITGLINNNATQIELYKVRSAASLQNVTDADLVDTSLIIVNFSYDTEDA